ncbi:MAG: PhzF family phenazine biosynthesis protein [Mariprofundaceae bacterium]|nr:PhzF family phenazine biosynthesis protein [Mariprofundaceae bacterium]
MPITMYQIDAFAQQVFQGNPAAVCPLTTWLPNFCMQAIAAENNLSETVFFVPNDSGFDIRWFTPLAEVDLCGHATLAAAFVIFNELDYPQESILFQSKSGPLQVQRQQDVFTLNFPRESFQQESIDARWQHDLGVSPIAQYRGTDTLIIVETESEVLHASPNLERLKQLESRGLILSSVGHEVDFVSRFFAPRFGIDEDPVTGSAHCMLAPYWADVLQKNELHARQLSKRGGDLHCVVKDERIHISGHAVKFMQADIFI